MISDEELIEGAVFSPNIGAKCPASELPLFEPDAAATEPNDKALIDIIRKELQAMNHAHARSLRCYGSNRRHGEAAHAGVSS